jgi:hypothetical protein
MLDAATVCEGYPCEGICKQLSRRKLLELYLLILRALAG